MKYNISRLATIFYTNNSEEISRNEIIDKYIVAALLSNNNKAMTYEKMSHLIEELFFVTITEHEISNSVQINNEDYTVTYYEDANNEFNLLCRAYKFYKNLDEKDPIELSIRRYYESINEQNKTFDDVKDTILNFLYNLFVKKLNGFSYIVGENVDIKTFNMEATADNYDENIVNGYLNFSDEAKDKAIFNIASYALEYCLFKSDQNVHKLINKKLFDKTFYLDTNLIFRLLGINGVRRQKRTSYFLLKCLELGQKLVITSCTRKEFLDSIDNHCKSIENFHSRRINPKVYDVIDSDGGVEQHFFKWANGRENKSLSLYKSSIAAELITISEEFEIKLDNKIYTDSSEFIEKETQYRSSIKAHLLKEEESIKHDAHDIAVVDLLREGHDNAFIDAEFFYISTDYSLKVWSDQATNYQAAPIIVYPDQWLTLMLRFSPRTSDDYKCFISFLNLSNGKHVIDIKNFNRILAGMTELTQDSVAQEKLIDVLASSEFLDFRGLKLSDYDKTIKRITKNYLDEELKKERAEKEQLQVELANKNEVEKKLRLIQEENERNKNLLQQKEKDEKKGEKDKAIEKLMMKYRRKQLFWAVPFMFCIYVLVGGLGKIPEKYNILMPLINTFDPNSIPTTYFIILIGITGSGIFTSVKKMFGAFSKDNQKRYAHEMYAYDCDE